MFDLKKSSILFLMLLTQSPISVCLASLHDASTVATVEQKPPQKVDLWTIEDASEIKQLEASSIAEISHGIGGTVASALITKLCSEESIEEIERDDLKSFSRLLGWRVNPNLVPTSWGWPYSPYTTLVALSCCTNNSNQKRTMLAHVAIKLTEQSPVKDRCTIKMLHDIRELDYLRKTSSQNSVKRAAHFQNQEHYEFLKRISGTLLSQVDDAMIYEAIHTPN